MSKELTNILKILLITFVLLFLYNTAFGKTITMEVDGKEIITITVSEEKDKTQESEKTTEEEPDCE